MGEQKVIQYTIIESVGDFIDATQQWLEGNGFSNKEKTIFSYGPVDDVYFSEDPDEIGMSDIYKSIGEVFEEGDDTHDLHKSRPIHELLKNIDEGEQFTLGGRIFEMVYADLEEHLDEE